VSGEARAQFSDTTRAEAREIVARYPRPRSALLPLLHLVQSVEGYVTADGIAFCAEVLDLTTAEVTAVSSYYTMFKREPTGEFLVSVCTNTLCGLLGGDEIFAALSEDLGVGHDQTAADGSVTLEHAECLAACDYAPVVTVNYEFFDNQTVDSARELVGALRQGERPAPTRGAALCPLSAVSRQLAGFPDEREDALAVGVAAGPTLAGVHLADERGEAAPPYPSEDGSSAGPPEGIEEQSTPSAHDAPAPTAHQDPHHPATHEKGEG
jgi:NADH-quinone oxidoreductase subunit E